jgi:hypothetical protein
MSAERGLSALLVSGLALLGGCGGGDEWWDDDEDRYVAPVDISIASPSITGFYATRDDQVRIAGTTSEWDAEIEWTDDAGGTGRTSPDYEFCFACRYDWAAVVPLAVGYNVITVIATNDGGVSMKSITIRRDESFAQWSWVR